MGKKTEIVDETNKPDLKPHEEELILCKICMNNYDDEKRQPKKLQCPHTFCGPCIDKYLVSGMRLNRKVKCPICREKTRCGSDGTFSLEVNTRSLDLVSLIKRYFQKKDKNKMLKYNGESEVKTPEEELEDHLDAYEVEMSKRTVVKSSNPILHPVKRLDSGYQCQSGSEEEDDDDEDDGKVEKSSKNKTEITNADQNNANETVLKTDASKAAPKGAIILQNMPSNYGFIPYPNKLLQDSYKLNMEHKFEHLPGDFTSEVIMEMDEDDYHQYAPVPDQFKPASSKVPAQTFVKGVCERNVDQSVMKFGTVDEILNGGVAKNMASRVDNNGSLKSNGSSKHSQQSSLHENYSQSNFQQYQRLPNSPFTANPAYFGMNNQDDNDDLDWNYFTQTSSISETQSLSSRPAETPDKQVDEEKGTMKSNVSNASSNPGVSRVNGFIYHNAPSKSPQQSSPSFQLSGSNFTDSVFNFNASSSTPPTPQPSASLSGQHAFEQHASRNPAPCIPQFHESAIFEGHTGDNLHLPIKMKACADGKVVVIDGGNPADSSNQSSTPRSDNAVHIFNKNGDKICSKSVPKIINDACLMNHDSNKLAVAHDCGVDIYDLSDPVDEPVKTIPLGSTSCLAPFKRGFVAGQSGLLNVCPDLDSIVLFYSLKYTNPAIVNLGNVKELDSCLNRPDIIAVTDGKKYLTIDGDGNVLKDFKPHPELQNENHKTISLSPSGDKLLKLDRKNNTVELHDASMMFGNNRTPLAFYLNGLANGAFPEEKILGGALVADNKVFLLHKGIDGFKIKMFRWI
ncbi:hypothetical protein HELRODRAFT_192456 [Helobdella robusta]|uniref:RING-type domain-containing protein n=1 Tax=Helobdella robusta TaxID=6412 RepID=T1FTZ5_HELRO|nr:hypothetical protein HELRODRAFT_192456 [Helobdella robusta]ESO00868.1 hypothetical protein HELRODRAFT_192456 [Helobdella robusta]